MSRRYRSKGTSEISSNEGTAARTRPFSLKEIMLHREKKATKEANKTSTGSKEEHLDNNKSSSDHLELERTHKSNDLKHTPKEGHTKQDRKSKRGEDRSCDKEKGMLDSEKLRHSKSSRDKESKEGKHSEIRVRNGDATRSTSRKEPVKRGHSNTIENDRIKERDEKPHKEGKRKSHGVDSDRRPEIPILKKHDSGRSQDYNYSDRNDRRKEHSKLYFEEHRTKWRRSNSRDYDRERRVRSVSLSPRAQKRSYYGHDHNDSPPHYSRDKPRRQNSEADRHRTSGNGWYGSGSYRKRGSGLGGYSPRKRKIEPKAEQTIKTPSPTVRSPERKIATWDQPPAGASQPSLVSSFQSAIAKIASSVPATPTASRADITPSLESLLTGKNAAIDSVQLTQATRPLRRLYIENLPISATEKTVTDCLNDFLLSFGVNYIQGTKPCLSCMINKEKGQALVEFLTPEDATAALSFDGRSFSGSVLRIRRPKDYVETASVAPEKPIKEIKVISDIVKDSPHKIFIAGISGIISSEMLIEIVSAFGPLAAYRFMYNEDLGAPCAFLEYIDHSITSKACAGLNGMKLGGCILTTVRSLPDASEEVSDMAPPFYGIPSQAKPLLVDPTKVLQLKNVFDREEFLLLPKPELEEILEDIRLECARFGAIKSLNVVKYAASSNNATEGTITEPKDEPVEVEAVAEGMISKQSEGVDDLCDTKGPQDLTGTPEDGTNSVRALAEDHEKKDFAESLPSDGALLVEPPLPAASPDHHSDLDDVGTRADLPGLGKGLVSEVPKKEDEHMVLALEVDQDASTVNDGSAAKGHSASIVLENMTSTITNEPNGDSEKGDANLSQVSPDKMHAVDARDDDLLRDSDVFEPGSVLVEFMRKEATCMAAHSLHGRLFGDRAVSAGYVPHDLYLARYPR